MGFILRDKLNESATTTVYRATDETLGREVLLKVLHRHLAHDEQIRQRFIREARACAALRSEYIVQVFDLREHEGAPAIVMEYVHGRSLKDAIAQESERSFALAEKVAVHVLRGLVVAHTRGIIHRDIKPGNILVSDAGPIKLTDFGLAQVAISPTLTAEGMVVGTPAYLAPEVIRGESADVRTDLFSLGATIVETFSGERLFEGATYSECLHRIASFRPDTLDRFAESTSIEFVSFLKKLMHPDRAQRFASPKEALAALGKVGSGQFALPETSRKKRGWNLNAMVATSVLVVLGAFILFRFAASPGAEPSLPSNPAVVTSGDSSASSQPMQLNADTVRKFMPSAQDDGMKSMRLAGRPNVSSIPDSGIIELRCDQPAKVHVDDRFIGETPLQELVRLASGVHTVVFSHPSFEPIVQTVEVAAGKKITVYADFMERAGFVRCSVSPWAEVYVDDVYRDTTPLDRPLVMTAGVHRLRFHHPSFRDSVWTVTVAPKETLDLTLMFKRP